MSPRKNRTKQDTLTAEFTTSQLVIGVVVALVFAIFFFALGVTVGKNDPSLNANAPKTASNQLTVSEKNTEKQNAVPPLTPTQQLLAQKSSPNSQRTPAPPRPRRGPYEPTAQENKVVALEKPAPETRSVELPAPPAKPVTPVKPEIKAPEKTAEKVEPAVETQEKQPPAKLTPSKSDEELTPTKADEAKSTPTAPPAEAPVSAPLPSSAEDGTFGIQIAAFLQPDGTSKANDLQKQLKSKLNIDARVFTSSDNNYSKVIIPGFKDKPEAIKACNGLKEKDPLLAGAWVTTIPQ